jgi:nitronate monooxygenase
MVLPCSLADRLAIPLVAAPMTGVSGPDLVIAACRAGVVGSFPTHNARSVDELEQWLHRITAALADKDATAPVAPNLVVHRTNTLAADVTCLVRQGAELVITSVGAPDAVLGPLHGAGCLVFADVATLRQVDRSLEAGIDGLVLLTAGAGGQTGHLNPFAFVRAVRERYDGPVVLAGGITDGVSLLAAQVLGADLAYMGTRFIATTESLAAKDYRDALVRASLDDITTSAVPSGLPANFLTERLDMRGAGLDGQSGFAPARLPPACAA